jgi:hypothetical protein
MLRLAGAALLCALIASPSFAVNNQFTSGGTTGAFGVRTAHTNQAGNRAVGAQGQVARQTSKNTSAIAPTSFGQLSPGGLPPTRLSSFVQDAGGSAELIYGDEGSFGIPPYFEFTQDHRIGSGIASSQLSTGHASTLPSAWGYAPGESSYSGGYNSGASADGIMPTIAPVLQATEPSYNINVPNAVYGTSGF